jgi:succinoglycan biosynthesis transport protein ExoP
MPDLASSYQQQYPPAPGHEGIPVPGGPLMVEPAGFGLRECMRLLRKHLRLITLCFLGSMLVTAVIMLLTPSMYTGKVTLLIERHPPQVLNFLEILGEPSDAETYDFYRTQYEILKSRSLAARVLQEQRLENSSLSTTNRYQSNALVRLWRHVTRGPEGDASAQPPIAAEEHAGEDSDAIDAYLARLEIQPVQRTQLVNIAFSAPSSELAARLANAHAQAYIRRGVELRTRSSEETRTFLEAKLVELKARVEKSEADLNRYRRHKGIISLDEKENVVVERLSDLNRRLTNAEAERIALEGQVRLLRKGHPEAMPAVVNNTLIQTLTVQAARLEAEYAPLAMIYKRGHPQLDQLKAQVDETKRRLRQETQRTVASLESAYLAAESAEKQLRSQMEAQKLVVLGMKDVAVSYAILAREVDTNRQLYDGVLQRMKEAGVAAELRASNVSIIDPAKPPRLPSKPKIKHTMMLGAFLGLVGGIGLAFLREYLEQTLKTPDEAQRYLQLPNLIAVPDFYRIDWQRALPQVGHVIHSPLPRHLAAATDRPLRQSRLPLRAVTEAYRMLRTAILLSRAEEPPRLLLFTSAIHGEGKTATVINTAIAFAHMGVRVLLIDADLRRPQCHRRLGIPGKAGLTDILTGHRGVEELIQPAYINNLFLLSSGALPPNPADLLGSRPMRDALGLLKQHYDYILIDTPPVLPVSDAVLLSTMVDGVVLVVSARSSPKPLVREACSRLRYARAQILGTLLNRVGTHDGYYASYYWPYESRQPETDTETKGSVSTLEGR